MSNEKIIWAIITVIGALALMLIDIKSDNVETNTKVDTHHGQYIRNFDHAEKDRDNIKRELFGHLKKH